MTKNLIIERKNSISQKIEAIYPTQLPSGIDINSILAEFMGADFIPKEQIDLHHKYRKLVEEHQDLYKLKK